MKFNPSSFGNNCGLYALALAVSVEVALNPRVRPDTVPKTVLNITGRDVHQDADDKKLQELNILLRSWLAEALVADQDYKLGRLENTIIPLILYDNASIDIEPFIKTNEKKRNALKIEVDRLLPKLIEEEARLQAEFHEIEWREESQLIAELVEDITHLSHDSDDMIELKNCLEEKYLDGETLDDLFQFCYRFHSAWNNVNTTTGTIKLAMREWFLERAARFCHQAEETEEQAQYANLLRLGQCYVFMDGSPSVLDNARELYLRTLLKDTWDDLYTDAISYIETAGTQLSVDELRVLAKHWQVSLRVDGYEYGADENDTLFSISLTNPALNHWQVIIAENLNPKFYQDYGINQNQPTIQASSLNFKSAIYPQITEIPQIQTTHQLQESLPFFDFTEIINELAAWESTNIAHLQTSSTITENTDINVIIESVQKKEVKLAKLSKQITQGQARQKKLHAEMVKYAEILTEDDNNDDEDISTTVGRFNAGEYITRLQREAKTAADVNKINYGVNAHDLHIQEAQRKCEKLTAMLVWAQEEIARYQKEQAEHDAIFTEQDALITALLTENEICVTHQNELATEIAETQKDLAEEEKAKRTFHR